MSGKLLVDDTERIMDEIEWLLADIKRGKQKAG